MSADPIPAYHDLLAAGTLAADTHAALDQLQRLRGLLFGDRPLCSVLRPRFLTPDQYRFIRRRTELLASAFLAAYRRGLADPAFRSQFGLHEWEERLVEIDPGFDPPHALSRLDGFLLPDGSYRVAEFNADAPAGAAFADTLADVFAALPAVQAFQRRFAVLPVPCRPGLLHALLDSFRRWQGHTSAAPTVAILDWREVPTYSEFVLVYDYLRSMGVEARIIDPRDLEYRDGKLSAGDYPITLVYKRVLTHQLIERCGPDGPLIRAARDRAVCVANAFCGRLLSKKSALAVLSDEANAAVFTPEQQQAVADHIPWTRVLADRKTTFNRQPIDLLRFAHDQQERLVLKPVDTSGGAGVVLGWAVSSSDWSAAVQRALHAPHVVQERIPLPTEPYPLLRDGTLHIEPRLTDTNPYVAVGAQAHGCLTRVSTGELVNVAAGGGSMVPTFLVEPR